jgi:restriction system protein
MPRRSRGGLTVVQAKQYTRTVGVEHFRELRGAMEDKKSGRGVIVTTSRFTKGAQLLGERFGGQVQLIDGPELVYMIKEVLGKDVVIGQRKSADPWLLMLGQEAAR